MKTNIKHTALLSRLSREDENNGTSESILTQKVMLSQYAQKHHFKNIIHYVDDGYSGTNFERPDFQRLMQDIKLGKIGIVITKELNEEILHQLINKIIIYEREIVDGKRIQKIEIEYNFSN